MKQKAPLKESLAVSGFFLEQRQIDEVLSACLQRGIPRDLIDVALSEQAAPKFTQLKARKNTDSWFAWTGKGALIGLLSSALLSLGIILTKGYEVTNQLALVQLLGPDIGIILGATFGALYGWIRGNETNVLMQRATDREDAMLLLVYMQPPDEARQVEKIFSTCGGQAIISEPMPVS
ncbi:hypothetical protein LG200_01305 [Methylobacillus caricis]|uniref:hypothetical protein n=1 Tax=Methylobacillus caricis TaxID=1971611 RepID=UPI001CFFC7F9|nr:hypothetical protein [Methylobacillus caricis]MCB5186636.1 hypothetical protein [Methylobacillus caricis]